MLNTPVLQEQYIELTDGSYLDLVASQPDYGYSAITQYSAEVSLDQSFGTYETLSTTESTSARMTVKQADVAVAMCNLAGVTSQEEFDAYFGTEPRVVYFRAVAELSNIEDSRIVSNVVSYNRIVPYFAVPQPGKIYLVGTPSGWTEPSEANAAHYANWALSEANDAIGSKVYSGVFEIPAQPSFRFYADLSGWDGGASMGSQEEDNPIEVTIDEEFTAELVYPGKGSFTFTNWEGGQMTITVDMSGAKPQLTIQAGAHEVITAKYMYIVGNQASWAEPNEDNASTYSNWRIADKDNSGIYTGTFDLEVPSDADGWYFRIYPELTGWGSTPYSSSASGDNVDIVTGTAYTCYTGEGCWKLNWGGGQLKVTLDTNTNQMTVDAVE